MTDLEQSSSKLTTKNYMHINEKARYLCENTRKGSSNFDFSCHIPSNMHAITLCWKKNIITNFFIFKILSIFVSYLKEEYILNLTIIIIFIFCFCRVNNELQYFGRITMFLPDTNLLFHPHLVQEMDLHLFQRYLCIKDCSRTDSTSNALHIL